MDDKKHESKTSQLADEALKESAAHKTDIIYQAVPRDLSQVDKERLSPWRVRFDVLAEPNVSFGCEIFGDVVFGRGGDSPDLLDLEDYDAVALGVSRRHAQLRMTAGKLFVVDLESTNGTRRNGHSIGVNTPYQVMNGDILSLGALQMAVQIIEQPETEVTALHKKADLADALAQVTKAITSQLELDKVLEHVVDGVMSITSADEALVWLVDEQTNEILLKSYRGIANQNIQKMRLSTESLVGQVIHTGQPIREHREEGGGLIKIKTGYLAEALLLLPITVGNVTFGVLGAVQRRSKRSFSERDEMLLLTIAEFAAVAVQNARLFQATDRELAQRVRQQTAVNTLSSAVNASLDLDVVHDVLIQQLQRYLPAQEIILWLVDEESGGVFPYHKAEKQAEQLIDGTAGQVTRIIREVIQSGEPRISTFDKTRQNGGSDEEETAGEIQTNTMACLPLIVKDRVVGVLSLFNKKHGVFSKDDLARLQGFAHPVATAIQNASLYSELLQERAIVDATVEALPQPVIIVGQRGKLHIANKAANRLLETSMSQLFEGISQGVGKTIEMTIDKNIYLATVEHSPTVGTITVMHDITYLKQLEAARLEFVQALTHDLKSPVSSIKAYTELIALAEKLSEKGQLYLTRIENAAKNVLALINQLLDIALLTEKPEKYHHPCNVTALMGQAIQAVEGNALAKSVTIATKVVGDRYSIRGEPSRLSRSIQNLLDNAIRHAPEDSQILATLIYGDEGITLSIRDDGPGIPPDELPDLFKKYYRGQRSDSRTGHGLGLMIVDTTVRSHGGAVSAANVEGHGAEFTITLPVSLRVKPGLDEALQRPGAERF
jgi:signal transduction histidine kinase